MLGGTGQGANIAPKHTGRQFVRCLERTLRKVVCAIWSDWVVVENERVNVARQKHVCKRVGQMSRTACVALYVYHRESLKCVVVSKRLRKPATMYATSMDGGINKGVARRDVNIYTAQTSREAGEKDGEKKGEKR